MTKVNPLRGQARLGNRVLHMTFETWMAFEVESDRKISEHMLDLELGLGCGDLVAWLRAFLQDGASEEEAVALVSAAGYAETILAVRDVVASFFGPLVEGQKKNPPKAA
jgi:hypothetical protein